MLKSIPLKKFIQLIFLLAFPITINFFSPYLIVLGAWNGIVNGSLIVFAILLIGSIFFGRLFCSTICPGGTLGDYMSEVNKKHVKNGKINWIKFGIWLPWMMAILTGFVTMGINEINFLFATESGISVDRPARYILYFGVVGIFVIVNLLVGKRAMCHYGCWMSPFMIIGISIRKVLHLPGLTLTADKDKCISCNKCSKVCPMSLDVLSMVQEDNMTNLECVLCTRCEEACPKAVIDLKFTK